MSPWQGIIPPELLDPRKKSEALVWIASLPVDAFTRKFILIEWCEITGVALTREMVEYVTGGRARDTWG